MDSLRTRGALPTRLNEHFKQQLVYQLKTSSNGRSEYSRKYKAVASGTTVVRTTKIEVKMILVRFVKRGLSFKMLELY